VADAVETSATSTDRHLRSTRGAHRLRPFPTAVPVGGSAAVDPCRQLRNPWRWSWPSWALTRNPARSISASPRIKA